MDEFIYTRDDNMYSIQKISTTFLNYILLPTLRLLYRWGNWLLNSPTPTPSILLIPRSYFLYFFFLLSMHDASYIRTYTHSKYVYMLEGGTGGKSCNYAFCTFRGQSMTWRRGGGRLRWSSQRKYSVRGVGKRINHIWKL